MNTLLIVDSHALIHRAYHAIPPLTTKSGIPTNALYGYINLIQKAIQDIQPTHLVACFDTPTESFRKQIVAEYQATRKPTEDNLKVQFNLVKELVDGAHVRRYEADGYEADDVIGTIVKQVTSSSNPFSHVSPLDFARGKLSARHDTNKRQLPQGSILPKGRGTPLGVEGESFLSMKAGVPSLPPGGGTQGVEGVTDLRVIILTGDKDMFQLVTNNVFVLTPQIGFSKSLLYSPKEVKEKLGIPPDKVADFKALSGDPSDNYGGLRNIGPKTAAKLIDQYGSIENMGERFDEETMITLRKMKQVSTIVCDVPNIAINFADLEFHGLGGEDFKLALQKYELYSLLARFFPSDKKKIEVKKSIEKPIEPPSQDSLF